MGEVSVFERMSLPHVINLDKETISEEQVATLLADFDKAIDELVKEREREGVSITEDLTARFARCRELVVQIDTIKDEELEKKKLLVGETRELAQAGDEAAQVKLEELYKMLDKMDIHEEVSRFTSHLDAIEALLAADQADKGRRFDFMLQELMRETNTMTAKCSSYAISAMAVDMKVELEKAREQAQNIV